MIGRGRWSLGLFLAAWMVSLPAAAAVWKADGQVGFIHFFVEMHDEQDPVTVLLRIENHSKVQSFSVSRYFVQMTDSDNQLVRAVSGDEVVSNYLRRLRQLMPQNEHEINELLGGIRADYPQEKIIEAYGRLKGYMQKGRPVGWRSQVENWFMGRPGSKSQQLQEAEGLIEAIGDLGKNYLWPNDIAPDASYTGMVFFERPVKQPVSIYFQMGEQFLGTKLVLAESDEKSKKKNK